MNPSRRSRLRRLSADARVSCVLTAYNYAEYLPRALDSALAQDHPADRLEVIVVDDGSTDATPALLAGYAGRVRVIRQDNAGVNAATSTGVAAATGDVIAFLDGDDEWPRDRVRIMVDALRAAPRAGLVYGDQEVIDAAGATIAPSLRRAGGVPALSGRQFGRLVQSNFISGGAMMVRAELKRRFCPIPPHGGYQDWWIAIQVARRAEVLAIPDTVNRYRLHGANANLGADSERRARLCETEIPFRRWVLGTLEPSVGVRQVQGAIRGFDANLGMLAGLRRTSPDEILALTAQDRAEAVESLRRASAALDRRAPGQSLLHLAAAVGHDPLWDQPRALIGELTPVLDRLAEAVAA